MLCNDSNEYYIEQSEPSQKQSVSCITPTTCASGSSSSSNCNLLEERYLTPSPVSSDTGISDYSQQNVAYHNRHFKPLDYPLKRQTSTSPINIREPKPLKDKQPLSSNYNSTVMTNFKIPGMSISSYKI